MMRSANLSDKTGRDIHEGDRLKVSYEDGKKPFVIGTVAVDTDTNRFYLDDMIYHYDEPPAMHWTGLQHSWGDRAILEILPT